MGRAKTLSQDGSLVSFFDFSTEIPTNRQELPEEYIENGSIYITRKKILKKYKNRLGGKISTYSMNSLSIFEIDTKEDLKTISLIFSSGVAKKAKIIVP